MSNIQYWAIASFVIILCGPIAGLIGSRSAGLSDAIGYKTGAAAGFIFGMLLFAWMYAAMPHYGIDRNAPVTKNIMVKP